MNAINGRFDEDYEYREACQPNQHGAEWTIHAILYRERCETVVVQKSHITPGQSYPSSASDSVAIRVRDIVYLMRRRLNKTIEEMAAEIGRLKQALVDEANERKTDKDAFKANLSQAQSNLEIAKNNAVILLETNNQLAAKQKDYEDTKEKLAKVREYLGKERFDQIIAMSTLEKMAGAQP